MSPTREYYVGVRRSVPAPVALFSLLALIVFFTGGVSAQTNSSSTTSHASVAHVAVSAPPANPSVHVISPVHNPTPPPGNGPGHGGHGNPPPPRFTGGAGGHEEHHHHYVQYVPSGPPVLYAVPVPYAVDIGATDDYADSDAGDNDPEYQGGPTVFDRRGSGEESYVPPVEDDSAAKSAQDTDGADGAEAERDPTLLVFKDGHELEIWNYAIVGATLFDLTPGHPRRVALADLDLEATRRQNDDRGVIFLLPTAMQAN